MMEDIAQREGIDLSADQGIKLHENKKLHLLFLLSKKYLYAAREWFEKHQNELNLSLGAELPKTCSPQLIIVDSNRRNNMSLKDNIELIGKYSYLIHTKIFRALIPYIVLEPDEISDRNGSAKVAIIAIESSLDAWDKVLNSKKELQNRKNCVNILLQLKQHLFHSFPKVMQFKRPGFDESSIV